MNYGYIEQHAELLRDMDFARAIASRQIKKWPLYEHEEGYGDAMLGLAQAYRDFDPNKGVKFYTFAAHRIRGAVIDGIRKRNGYRSGPDHKFRPNPIPVSLGGRVNINDDESRILDVADPEQESTLEGVEEEELRRRILQVINRLEDREKMMVTLYYFEGMSLRAIGDVYGLTESRMCQIMKGFSERLYRIVA